MDSMCGFIDALDGDVYVQAAGFGANSLSGLRAALRKLMEHVLASHHEA